MQNEEKRPYKLNIGQVVTVSRQEHGDYVFYSVKFKKTYNGQEIVGSKGLRFNKDVELPDGVKIRLLDFFEDYYRKGYETIWNIYVKDFEIVNPNEEIEKYNSIINNDYEMPF